MLTYRDITMKLIDRSPLLQPQPLLQRQTLRHRAPLLSSRQARSLPWLISCLGVSGLVVGCGADQGSSDGTELHTGGSGGVDAGTGGMIGATGGMIGATGGTGGLATGGVDGGTGGDASTGGDTGSGGADPVGSDGCGMSTAQPAQTWVASDVSAGAGTRSYDVWLPENYDAERPYPVILLLHGCGSPVNNVPMEGRTGSDAIVVRGAGSGNDSCWDEGQDLPYIDALLEDVQARFCVNPDHLFAVGYSSGSWIASKLSCTHGDVFRGIASVAGGEPGGIQNCKGQVARMFVHDTGDMSNLLEWDEPSRDRMIQTNNCDSTTVPVDPSPCVEYQNCDPGYPVVWCATTGKGHDRQDSFAAPAFWAFFQSLIAP